MEFRRIALAAAVALCACAQAEDIVLKVHHPLPPTSTSHREVLTPWCEKVAAESKQRIKCQIYPAMQLGGTSTQLYDQAKDGVVDVIWTIPSYQAGRFPLIEVFELPFMTRDAEAGSKAVWDYVQQHAAAEFKDVKPLAFHVHGGGVLHMVKKPVARLADLRRVKLRAPTRQTTKLLAALGAVPVGMPIPQVPEALSKGVIDGALLPYEVLAAVKADELTSYHSEPDASQPTIYTSVFILAMNKSRYEGLPPDLKKVIDANSGVALSGQIGRIFQDAEATGRKALAPATINVIPKDEIGRWRKAAQSVTDAWVKEMSAKGFDGQALLDGARSLIAKHSR